MWALRLRNVGECKEYASFASRHAWRGSRCTTELTQPQLNRNRITTTSLFSAFPRAAILAVSMWACHLSCQPLHMSRALVFTVACLKVRLSHALRFAFASRSVARAAGLRQRALSVHLLTRRGAGSWPTHRALTKGGATHHQCAGEWRRVWSQ